MTDPSHIAAARKKLSRPQIREVFLRNGARIEPGRDDLPDHVYESVFELLEMTAPAVQGEPVAWSGWGCQYPGKMPRLYGDRRIAELNCDTENGDQVLYFTAAPQPAEQQPAPGVDVLVEALTMARETIASALRANAPDYFTTDADIARHVVIQRIDAALKKERNP